MNTNNLCLNTQCNYYLIPLDNNLNDNNCPYCEQKQGEYDYFKPQLKVSLLNSSDSQNHLLREKEKDALKTSITKDIHNSLQKELADNKRQIESLQKELADNKGQIESLQKELADNKGQIESLKQKLNDNNLQQQQKLNQTQQYQPQSPINNEEKYISKQNDLQVNNPQVNYSEICLTTQNNKLPFPEDFCLIEIPRIQVMICEEGTENPYKHIINNNELSQSSQPIVNLLKNLKNIIKNNQQIYPGLLESLEKLDEYYIFTILGYGEILYLESKKNNKHRDTADDKFWKWQEKLRLKINDQVIKDQNVEITDDTYFQLETDKKTLIRIEDDYRNKKINIFLTLDNNIPN